MKGRVLVVAGSDSGGGAGIQADIKTVTALGGFAMTAITALTAQTTEGVYGIHDIPPEFVVEQMRVVINDIGVDCIKIGMLHRPEIIDAVAKFIEAEVPDIPVVLDPVMIAKGGAPLLVNEAVHALKEKMISKAYLLTPNLPEAKVLTGETDGFGDELEKLGNCILSLGPQAALVKGGHGKGEIIQDILVDADGVTEIFTSPRIDTVHTHGTGCTLASAISIGLAQGMNLRDAVDRARNYVIRAIESAPGLGNGFGPINHAHTVNRFDT